MSVNFELVKHGVLPNVTICEIWVGEKMVGVIYPEEPNAIRVITKHIEGREGELLVIRFEL